MYIHVQKWADRKIDIQTEKKTDSKAELNRQRDRQTYRETDSEIEVDRQTELIEFCILSAHLSEVVKPEFAFSNIAHSSQPLQAVQRFKCFDDFSGKINPIAETHSRFNVLTK